MACCAATFLLTWSGHAAPVPLTLEHCGKFEVASILSGDRLKDTSGRSLQLAAVKAPEIWPKEASYGSWPYAEKSRAVLASKIAGQTLELFCSKERQTYDGELIAHILLSNGRWLQHDLIREGTVFLFPRAEQKEGLEDLRAAELIARNDQLGLWAELDLPATVTGELTTGRFKIVSGTVLAAARSGNRIFLNFGDNWRRDFTVEIPRRFWRHFESSGIELLELQGQRIEARGWITWKGGPHILLEGPGQLRLIQESEEFPG